MLTRTLPLLTWTCSLLLAVSARAAPGASGAGPGPVPSASPGATAAPVDRSPPPADAKDGKPKAGSDGNQVLRLYTDGYGASYLAVPGFWPVDMPVRDATDGAPGCYLACDTRERKGSIYAPDANTFVVGAIRILGSYQNGVCRPGGQEHADLASDNRLTELCALAMPKLCDRRRCFASGDTGTWVTPAEAGSTANNAARAPTGQESCVLACYSHSDAGALYQVASDTFAVGGFQTGGHYVESVCKPRNFEGDLAQDPNFKHHCTELFPKQCANDGCWLSGDTRGRLGGT